MEYKAVIRSCEKGGNAEYPPPTPPPLPTHTHTHTHNPCYINIHPHHPTPTSPFTISIKGINDLSSEDSPSEGATERERRRRKKIGLKMGQALSGMAE